MKTVLLLIASNVFMTFAWYDGHLKHRQAPLLTAILVSWLIAFGEYCLQVPANRIGYGRFTAYQLKLMQEAITLGVFVVFAYLYLGEVFRWNHAVSFFVPDRRRRLRFFGAMMANVEHNTEFCLSKRLPLWPRESCRRRGSFNNGSFRREENILPGDHANRFRCALILFLGSVQRNSPFLITA